METHPPPPVLIYSQEDDLTEECRELLSSLPLSGGWIGKHVYQYEGCWLTPRHLQGLVSCREHFQACDTDTILATNPKSGTTWLKAMAYAIFTRSSFNILGHDHPLLNTNPQDLVPCLELELFGGTSSRPSLTHMPSPRIFASHAPVHLLARSVKESSCKIVYMSRDPKSVFVSFWHFCNKLRPEGLGKNKLEDKFDDFCDGASAYGPVWDHVLGYWNWSLENPRKVLFLRYEEVKEQPTGQLRRLAEFLGCPFSHEEESKGVIADISRLCSFDSLSNMEVNKVGSSKTGMVNHAFFRKGNVGGWAEVLTPEMANRIDHITEEKMTGSGFTF